MMSLPAMTNQSASHRGIRFLAREIYHRVMTDFRTRQAITRAA